MLRRNARLRREYLYRKSLEGKDREEYERKLKIRRALEGQTLGSTLPYKMQYCLSTNLQKLLPSHEVFLLVQRASPFQQSCARTSRHCGTI